MSGLVARCPGCGARAPEDAARCGGCGRRLADDVVVLEEGAPDEPVVVAEERARRERAGRRRRAALVAAVVVLGAVLVRVVAGGDDRPPLSSLDRVLPAIGPGSGARLLALTDDGLVTVDVDADVVLPVDVPAGGRPLVVERRGTAVIVSGGRAWVLQRPGRLLDLGPADGAFPSQAPDRVWLAEGGAVREVGLDGRLVRGPVHVPATAAAGDGLVVSASGGVQLHHPETGELLRRVDDLAPLVEAGGDWVVTADREELRCDLVVVDLADGRRRRVPLLPYRMCLQGRSAMSPDGRRLVLPVAEYVHGSGTRNGSLVVVDVVRGTARRVPRTERPIPLFSSPTWAPSGRWVFWADPVGPQAIGAYRLGSDGAVAVRPSTLGPGRVRGLWATRSGGKIPAPSPGSFPQKEG